MCSFWSILVYKNIYLSLKHFPIFNCFLIMLNPFGRFCMIEWFFHVWKWTVYNRAYVYVCVREIVNRAGVMASVWTIWEYETERGHEEPPFWTTNMFVARNLLTFPIDFVSCPTYCLFCWFNCISILTILLYASVLLMFHYERQRKTKLRRTEDWRGGWCRKERDRAHEKVVCFVKLISEGVKHEY